MRWWLLALTCLLSLAMFSTGCAARIVSIGSIYYVEWPEKPDIVEIHDVLGDGWARCRSVRDRVVWTCNLNAALYLVRVQFEGPSTPSGEQVQR